MASTRPVSRSTARCWPTSPFPTPLRSRALTEQATKAVQQAEKAAA
ncbi:MAG: hypothetical protein WDN31_14920 [Hyphomicrobium sp.]